MLSIPWCEVVRAEIRACNLPTANPALYYITTSALLQANTKANHECWKDKVTYTRIGSLA